MRTNTLLILMALAAILVADPAAAKPRKIQWREKPSVTGSGVHARAGVVELNYVVTGHRHDDPNAASERGGSSGVIVEPRYIVRWDELGDPLARRQQRPIRRTETLYGDGEVWTQRGTFSLWIVPQGGPNLQYIAVDYVDPMNSDLVIGTGPRFGRDPSKPPGRGLPPKLPLTWMNQADEHGRNIMTERLKGIRVPYTNVGQTLAIRVTSYTADGSKESSVITVHTLPEANY